MRFFPRLLLLLCLSLVGLTVQAAQDPAKTEQQLKQVKQQISTLQAKLAKRKQVLAKAESELRSFDKRIGAVTAELRQLDDRQQQLETRRGSLGDDEARLAAQLQQQEALIRDLLREQYKLGRQPAIELLLSQQDPQQLSRMLHYYDSLTSRLSDELQSYRARLQQLTETQSAISMTDDELLATRTRLQQQRKALAEAREGQAQTLATLRQAHQQDSRQLGRLKDDQAELEAVLKEIRRSLEQIRLEQDGLKFSQRKGKMDWPVAGGVQRAFGSRVDNVSYEGMLISAKAGATVKAVHHGRVVFADWLRGYGLVLILDHGNGYLSLYGHNESLLREPGEWVGTGESLALAGSSGGSAEPGLYFAIRYKGRSIDPIVWLKRR
ncbi:murein hydrolase activator EnvC family protein [Marinobacterium sediminicola]|uniref:Septal ring factor EnvC, activator of murein hydrolases AmiA and AmiB n=1 Tax=Marinobacterium sediminicola TaxID=518898 RepID=A0ABY1RZ87_9GAMM|nr:peptidoglycan DD-metalloendopeptidase family protein [Marinobacterium sediminicola]ULG69184.1 peptidoglycan DD-metalloendopeptidase family protein [Marinobacterium sediminicola]SMR73533.1 Septal ring factor EnvC, activator of murein hydrolases AmiA and AmiB [Marinobacterium sediminicola]